MEENEAERDESRDLLFELLDYMFKRVYGKEWSYIPVWHEDAPAVVVPMGSLEYRALLLCGYPTSETEEPDWDIVPPPDTPKETLDAIYRDGIAVMRDHIASQIAKLDAEYYEHRPL